MSTGITNEPAGLQIVFGLMSNIDLSNTNDTNVITLDQINMDYNLFMYLFYNTPSQSFSIAKANENYSLLKYYNLTSSGNRVSLVDLFLSTFENTKNTNRNSLSPLKTITLVKNLSQYSSLVDVLPYSISLTYSDLTSALTEALVILPSKSVDDFAEVVVLLSTKIYSPVLDVYVTLNLPIGTSIPGFINPTSLNLGSGVGGVALPLSLPATKHTIPTTVLEQGKYSNEELTMFGNKKVITKIENILENISSENSVDVNHVDVDNNDNSSEDVDNDIW